MIKAGVMLIVPTKMHDFNATFFSLSEILSSPPPKKKSVKVMSLQNAKLSTLLLMTDINFAGSSPAMEAEGATVVWSRSVELHNIRYKWMLFVRDNKAFNAVENTYGDHCMVEKLDCEDMYKSTWENTS